MQLRTSPILAILLSASISLTADETNTKDAAKPVWTTDLAKMKGPNAKVSGTVHGLDFALDKAELENGVLTLQQGKDFFPDLALKIFLFPKDGENLEGKSYKIAAKQGFGNPHVHVQWKAKGQQLPDTEYPTKTHPLLPQ